MKKFAAGRSEFWFSFFEWMRAAQPLVGTLLVFVLLLALSQCASAQCLPSAGAVQKEHPGVHASYSLQVSGHKGRRCWMTDEERQQLRRAKRERKAAPLLASAGRQETKLARLIHALPVDAAEPMAVQAPAAAVTPVRWIVADRFEDAHWGNDPDLTLRLEIEAAGRRRDADMIMGWRQPD